MSRWDELFENHAIHATIAWLKECVSAEFDDLDSNEVSEKRRFLKLISKYDEVLNNQDPELVPYNQLDSLNKGLRNPNIANPVNAYKENGDVANLVAANDVLNTQLTVLSLLLSLDNSAPSLKPVQDLEELVDSISEKLISKKDALLEEFEGLKSDISNKEQTLAKLTSLIEQRKLEVDTHLTDWQKQFSNAQEGRSQDFTKWRDNFVSKSGDELDSIFERYEEKISDEASGFEQEVGGLLDDSIEKHQSILDLYQLTAGDSVAAGYLKNAADEQSQADNWRRISMGFIFLTIIWMLFAYFTHEPEQLDARELAIDIQSNLVLPQSANADDKSKIEIVVSPEYIKELETNKNEINWFQLFITFSISGILLWGSAYSAQQSTKHRKNEKRTRWFALEVKAIDPFISKLTLEQQNDLKNKLSDRMFGQYANLDDDNTKVADEHVFKIVADTFGELLSKLPRP